MLAAVVNLFRQGILSGQNALCQRHDQMAAAHAICG